MAHPLFLRFYTGDLKLMACTEFAHADMNLHHAKTPGLEKVAAAFRFNVARLRFTMLVPAHVGNLATEMQFMTDLAEFEVTGEVTDTNAVHENEGFRKRLEELFHEDIDQKAEERNDPEWHSKALVQLRRGTWPAEMLGTLPHPISLGLSSMLSSYITSTWTAFETLSGDLWEAAVNTCPDRLAHLKGDPKRLLKGRADRSGQSESKSVPLDLLQRHRFDIKDKMGTILRERFAFSRLEDIRRAYGQAFDTDQVEIDSALTNKSIDALCIMRNLIVHQAGNADEHYIKVKEKLNLPAAALNKPILLDGQKVVNLISPVIRCADRLLRGVDQWLLKRTKEAATLAALDPG